MKFKFCIPILLFFILSGHLGAQRISIGSKIHPESRLLAEITAQLIEQNTDLEVHRRFGLGGTLICFEALRSGEIDLYIEYSGTALTAILGEEYHGESSAEIMQSVSEKLKRNYGMHTGPSLGFSNSYVLVARPELGLQKISDLKNRTDLTLGFSNEFVNREDGFSGLNRYYDLRLAAPHGMEHGLAYKALEEGQIDITDAYSTDARLTEYELTGLSDDRHFFPAYDAFPLFSPGFPDKDSALLQITKYLENILTEEEMQQLNYRYEVRKENIGEIAFDFLSGRGLAAKKPGLTAMHPVLRQTLEHIRLTFLATFLGILLAVPLALYIVSRPRPAALILSVTGVIQTIPSLALLGFMIPVFGIGFLPALLALFLYALLPIVRNTYSGLKSTDPLLLEAAQALGMTRRQILLQLRLPLAMDIIMAGIRTALTINIGTATLAAFIGAGGLGESIITGITLNDHALILSGAIPAAILALAADQGMAIVEKAVRPRVRSS